MRQLTTQHDKDKQFTEKNVDSSLSLQNSSCCLCSNTGFSL